MRIPVIDVLVCKGCDLRIAIVEENTETDGRTVSNSVFRIFLKERAISPNGMPSIKSFLLRGANFV